MDLKTPQAVAFHSLYADLVRSEGKVPRKSLLTPERCLSYLGNVFIVERRPAGFFFRLFGTVIVDLIGLDNTGKFLGDVLLSPEDVRHIDQVYADCLDNRRCIATTERVVYPGREFLKVEILRCPFVDDTDEARFIAGTFAAIDFDAPDTGPKVLTKRYIAIQRDAEPRITAGIGQIAG